MLGRNGSIALNFTDAITLQSHIDTRHKDNVKFLELQDQGRAVICSDPNETKPGDLLPAASQKA